MTLFAVVLTTLEREEFSDHDRIPEWDSVSLSSPLPKELMMRTLVLAFLSFVLILGSLPAQAQPWSGILDPSRAIDWSNAGVRGGIPTNRTQCGSTIAAYTGSASAINSAIAACGNNQYVKLGAGTFNLSSGITFAGKSNVTLRGSGPNATFLVFTGNDPCLGQYTTVCIGPTGLSYYGPGPPTYQANWTAHYTKGDTLITLSATTGLSVGMFIILDQLNDASNPGSDLFVCNTQTTCTVQGGTTYGRSNRSQRQWVQVTNISGKDVTITPGLHMPNWNSGKSPGAYWGASNGLTHGDGVEDLSIDAKNSKAGASAIEFIFTYDGWAKNVRIVYGPDPRCYVCVYSGARVTIRDSYFFGNVDEVGAGMTHYGIETSNASDILVENNIIQRRTSPFVSDGDDGSVYGYNFVINDIYNQPAEWMQASQYSHESGNGMILHESNQAVGIKGDIIHGTSNLFTYFRNYSYGFEPGKTGETYPVVLYSYNRYYNFIGNVLGTVGYHSVYQASSGDNSIWALGRGSTPIPADSVVATTIMRWGNYDTVTGTSRFVSSEVPSGLVKYPNAVPPSQILPASFYLAAKPAWFGNNAWPSIGPDISGGTGPGNHVKRIPARVCFEDVMGGQFADSTPRAFDANNCYYGSGGGGTPLPPPQNLRAM